MVLVLAVVASLLVAAAPAAAATTSHYREQGSGLSAGFSNVVWDDNGDLLPGSYFETWVDAATYLTTGDGSGGYQYACVNHWEFTIDAGGNWVDESWFGACGEASVLTFGKGLSNGHIVAAFEAEECLAWDDQTGACLATISLGEVAVDVTLTGTGSIERWHGTGSGGSAGMYQYTYHGTGSSRSGNPTGSVTLGGASLTAGATWMYGSMFTSKSGSMDVWHG
jgi:hypothetical protein